MTGRASHVRPPAAWIPDASFWAGFAHSPAATRIRATGITLARTTLVIVMPRSAAALTPAFGTAVSWRFLLPASAGGPAPALGLHVEFPDPASSATGLMTLAELQRLLGKKTLENEILREALKVAHEKKLISHLPSLPAQSIAPSVRLVGCIAEPPSYVFFVP